MRDHLGLSWELRNEMKTPKQRQCSVSKKSSSTLKPPRTVKYLTLTFRHIGQRHCRLVDLHLFLLLTLLVSQMGVGVMVAQTGTVLVALPTDCHQNQKTQRVWKQRMEGKEKSKRLCECKDKRKNFLWERKKNVWLRQCCELSIVSPKNIVEKAKDKSVEFSFKTYGRIIEHTS